MQYWSKTYIPTLKESPAEAEIESHKLLLRAGLVRKIGGGLYAFLPLGKRVLDKVSQICREEMNAAGAIELFMPAVLPAEQWKAGPRWNAVREVMYSVSSAGADAKISEDPQYVLGPTHEEVITPLIGSEISSYRDLGKTLYKIQTKYRNEIRPRNGLMRAREFIMKDGYSFDESDEKAEETYHQMAAAYEKFFARCGLTFISVEADTGIMGGAFSHEFMVPAEVGDDDVVYCEESGYAANVEKASSGIVTDGLSVEAPEGEVVEFETPGATTINALAKEPYKVAAARQYKTLLYVGDDKLFAIVIRGCDDLQESKLGSLGYEFVRPATPDEIESAWKDDGKLHLQMTCHVNGKKVSDGNTNDLYHSFGDMIERASMNTKLIPGEYIGSGTVGTGCILELRPENAGGWLKKGDIVTLEIERLGILENKIV